MSLVEKKAHSRRSMLSRFGVYIALVGLVGFGLAIWADATDADGGYRDALREMGGAIVSGAVLAGLVVWFEDRREAERVQHAEQRDDETAMLAWRREIDLRLLVSVTTELPNQRLAWRRDLSAASKTPVFSYLGGNETAGAFRDTTNEVSVLLNLLQDEQLNTAWHSWRDATISLESDVPAPKLGPIPPLNVDPEEGEADGEALERAMREQDRQLRVNERLSRLDRDPKIHRRRALHENDAWRELNVTLSGYIARRYPLTATEPRGVECQVDQGS